MVCDFCEKHLEANKQAFADPRLHLIIDDARAQLEAEGPFDVIIGDLADPVFGGPCYQVQPPDIPLASFRYKHYHAASTATGILQRLILCTGGTLVIMEEWLTWDES